jgi:choline transport protein
MWSYTLNGFIGLFVLITFLFCLPDLTSATSAPGGPFLYVFQQSSYWGGIPLIILILAVALTGTIDSNASTSRQIFAFARDGGLPFARWLSTVSKVSLTVVLRRII